MRNVCYCIDVQGIQPYLQVQATKKKKKKKDYTLDIVAARAGMRINKVNSVKKDAFPQHNISNAEYKEIFISIYKYKYTFGLAVVGG